MRSVFYCFFAFSSFILNAQTGRDSLFAAWNNKTLPDTVRLQGVDELIWTHYLFSKPDSAFLLTQQMETFARKGGYDFFVARALNMQGVYYKNKADYPNAIFRYRSARDLYLRNGSKKGSAGAISNIGQVQALLGSLPEAVEEYFTALKIFEETGDRNGQVATLINIGSAYQVMKREEEAMNYYMRAKAIAAELKNKRATAICLNNISLIQREKGNYSEALRIGIEAIELRQSMNDQAGLATAYESLGETYFRQRDFEKARTELDKSMALFRELNDSGGIATCYQTIASIDFESGHTAEAIRNGRNALAIAQDLHMTNLSRKSAELLTAAYRKNGDYRSALQMFEIAVSARDSMKNSEAREALTKEQLKYDYQKKEIETRMAADQKFMQLQTSAELEKSKRNTILIVLMVLLVLLALSVFFIARTNRQRQTIAEQKNNLLKQKLLISQLNPHFIFNSLNAVQNFIFSQDSLQAGTYLSRFAALMRMILDFSREDFISVRSEIRFLTEYLELQRLRFRDRFSFEIIIDDTIDPDTTFIPPMLAQPFLENAIEHGISRQSSGRIGLRIFRENKTIRYEIDDNGIGLAAAQRERKNSSHRSLATVITRERLQVLNRQNNETEILIRDKQADVNGETGVQVLFTVPFYEEF